MTDVWRGVLFWFLFIAACALSNQDNWFTVMPYLVAMIGLAVWRNNR